MPNRIRDIMKRTFFIYFGLLLASAAPSALAFQPLITDDTGTQGAGGNQFEFSVNKDKEQSAGETIEIRTLPLVYTRGFSDTLDFFIGVNHTSISSSIPGIDASGSGNPSFGFKWRFYENEESKTSLGIKPEIVLPVSADKEGEGLGTGENSYGLTLILTQETSFGAVHANFFVGRDRYSDLMSSDASIKRASIAPVWKVAEEWNLALDVGAETESAGGESTRSKFVEIGAIYSPSKELDFALGLIRVTDNAQPSTETTSATLGVTWHFN